MNKIIYSKKHKAGLKVDERFDVDLDFLTKKEFELFKNIAQAVRANIEIFGFSKEYQEHFAAKPELNTKYGWDQLEHISIFARFSKRVISFTRGRARIRYRGKTKSVARAPQHCTIHNATNFTIYPQ
tara:strand:+ start:133 stop:513 length:381 start_codon:yes stop_codon:yes gene_type:complete